MKKTTIILVLILLLGAALRFYGIAFEGFDFDESYQVHISGQPTLGALFHELRLDFNPPLFHVLLHYWMLLFGKTEFAVRMLTALISIACLVVVFLIAKKIFNEKAALIATFITAIVPIQVSTAQHARPYALFSLLVLLSYLFYLDYLQKKKHLVPYTIATTLLLYTHYYSAFFIAAQTVYAAWKFRSDRKRLLPFIGAQAIAGALFLIWLPQVFRIANFITEGRFWIGTPEITSFFDIITLLTANWIGLFVISFFIVLYATTETAQPVLLWWFSVPTVLPFLASVIIAPFLISRYIIPAGFPLYILSGRSIARRKELYFLLFAFTLICAQALNENYTSAQGEQFKEVGTVLTGYAENDTVIVYVPQINIPLELYYDGAITQFPPAGINPLNITPEETEQFSDSIAGSRVWLVISHDRSQSDDLIRTLLRKYPRMSAKTFTGVTLYRLDAIQNASVFTEARDIMPSIS